MESSPEEMLLSTAAIDASLSAWRNSLPYHLRYDLGHTFEKSKVFKRRVRLSLMIIKIEKMLTNLSLCEGRSPHQKRAPKNYVWSHPTMRSKYLLSHSNVMTSTIWILTKADLLMNSCSSDSRLHGA